MVGMHLKSLYLRNFRNYEEAEVHFGPRINLLHGENAQGKTNLLEAIYFIATGRSFRTQHLTELIRSGQPFFYLEATLERDGVTQTFKISFDGQNRKLQTDANTYTSFHPLLGTLPSVLYTPQDTEIISGTPAIRRRFLNLHLAQSDPLYVHHLTRFWRAMKQRNCLLRLKDSSALECWEIEMAHSAQVLLQKRTEMIEGLKACFEKQSARLAGGKEAHEIRFHPSYPAEISAYLQQLKKNRAREMDLGLTLTGPHRDDLTLLIDAKPARLYASEGQKKTAIAALRLAEWDRLTESVGAPALLGIDDLGLHLDERRQTLLRASLEELGQVFVTAPYLPSTWKELQSAKALYVEKGNVSMQQPSVSFS